MNLENKSVRVVIITIMFIPYISGAESFIINLVKYKDLRFKPIILTPLYNKTFARFEQRKNYTIIRVGIGNRKIDWFLFPLFGLYWIIKNRNSITLLHPIILNQCAVIAYFANRLFTIPYILTMQNGDDIRILLSWAKPIWPIFLSSIRNASVIHTISEYLANRARKLYYGGPIVIIPNGVDLNKFNQVFQNHSFKFNDSLNIISISRLVKSTGIDILLSSVLEFDHILNYNLHIFGDGLLKEEFLSFCRENNIENNVKFYGHKSHTDIIEIIRDLSFPIFIRPSRYEGFGNAYIEAMALGLPTVGTKRGAIPEYLHDGYNGFLLEYLSPVSIKNTIINILNLPRQQLISIIENGRKTAEAYNWKRIIQNQFMPLYVNLLKST